MCRYRFELEDGVKVEEDAVFERSGAHVVVDDASLALLAGATVDFEDEVRWRLPRFRVSVHDPHVRRRRSPRHALCCMCRLVQMMKSAFVVSHNPQSSASCGCGTSFQPNETAL